MTGEENLKGLLYFLVLPIALLIGIVWLVHWRSESRRTFEEAERASKAPPEMDLELEARPGGVYLKGDVVNVSSRRLESAQIRIVCLNREKEGGEQPAPVDIETMAPGERRNYDRLLPAGCGGFFAPYRIELAAYKLKN